MNKNIDMLHGKVTGSLIRFAIPLVLTGWLQMLFNSADSMVVGRFAGSTALASVGATFPFVMLVVSFFGGLAAGVTVCASNDVGAADHDSFRETLHVSVLLAVIVGCFVSVLGECLARPVLRMMNAPEDIIDGSTIYLRIYFLCMPAQMVYNTCASVMRARGDSRKPLFFLTISGVANVVMNVLFVAVFKWSVVGVAVATVITQYLSAVLAMGSLMRESDPWRLDLRKLCLRKDKIARILKIGVPAGLQVSMLAASDIPLQTAVNSLGSLAVSGNAAAMNIEGIVFSTIESVCQSCTVFTGQCVGARMFDRTKKVLGSSMGIALLCGVILGAVAFLLRFKIIGLFLPENPEAVAYGADRAAAVVTFLFVYSVMGTLNGSLRGYGISLTPALINIFALFCFRFSWAKFYFPHHQSLFHLYISYPLAWSIAIILLLIIYRPSVRKAMDKLAAAPAEQ